MSDSKKELTLTRTILAPRETVWKTWTDAEQIRKWWGPDGVTIPTCEFDARVGGAIKIVMLAGKELGPLAGQEWPMEGTVKELQAPEKLVFVGQPLLNGKPFMESLNTITLKEQDGKTLLSVHIEVFNSTPEAAGPLSGMEMGWNQQLDKLVHFLT